MGAIKRAFYNNILGSGKFDATDLTGTIPSANITGSPVQALSSDPPSPTNGQIWYNTSDNALRASVFLAGALAWSSGGNLGTARNQMSGGSGFGIQTAGALAGGGVPTSTANVEEYNGSAWSEVNNLPEGLQWGGGMGTLTAGIHVGGTISPGANRNTTRHYDGTNWTSGGNLAATGRVRGCFGTQTAGITAGGSPRDSIGQTAEEYDGSSWTAIAAPAFKAEGKGAGSASPVSAGIIFGGSPPGPQQQTETWNGSAWSTGPNMSQVRRYMGGFGTATASIAAGGSTSSSQLNATEQYNGTAWSTAASYSTARGQTGGSNTATTAGYIAGGETPVSPSLSAATEEYTVATPGFTTKTVTTS